MTGGSNGTELQNPVNFFLARYNDATYSGNPVIMNNNFPTTAGYYSTNKFSFNTFYGNEFINQGQTNYYELRITEAINNTVNPNDAIFVTITSDDSFMTPVYLSVPAIINNNIIWHDYSLLNWAPGNPGIPARLNGYLLDIDTTPAGAAE